MMQEVELRQTTDSLMRVIGIVLLVLIGGFTGLCSAGFTIVSLGSSGDMGIVLPFAVPGFIIAFLSYLGIRALLRKSQPLPRALPSFTTSPAETDPPAPPPPAPPPV